MQDLTIPAQIDHLEVLFNFVNDVIDKAGIDDSQQGKLIVAVEEIFVNISNYAYPDSDGNVFVTVDVTPDKILFEFKDTGIPYNPLEKSDPDITLSASERAIGGLGIFMVKKIMDDVLYKHENGQNVLTLVKNR